MNNMQMLFKHNNFNNPNHPKNLLPPPKIPTLMSMNTIKPNTNNNTFTPAVSLASIQNGEQVKMKWGEPIWFLFHTLAQKIREDNFANTKNELLTNIINICTNLPCPKCANHAVDYMRKINFDTIRTRDDLKKMLFLFHNTVNAEKGFPLFEYDKLDEKYDKANTVNIIHNFIKSFSMNDFNVNMINSNFQRNLLIGKLKIWFTQNIQYFDR
jgi:hypothetical protein